MSGIATQRKPAAFTPPVLAVLFVGSGCSALIYEVVWLQLLQSVIGASAVSVGVLLGTFMGGMGLGSWLLPRLVGPGRHPLRVYALLELGIAVCGMAVLAGVPAVGRLYVDAVGRGSPGLALRALVGAACLLPPALLMGATLPAAARWVGATPTGAAWLGLFYAGNVAGAVVGCVATGFYLLRVYDVAVATAVAVGINLAVAAAGFVLAVFVPHQERGAAASEVVPENVGGMRWPVYLAAALSGFGALGAEVVWTRLLSLLLGATVYTFSIILAVFLVGIGLGSGAAAALTRAIGRPAAALAGCQALLVVAVSWAAYQITAALPYWPVDGRLAVDPWVGFQLDLARCLWAVLPAACLWGASFPLAVAAAVRGGDAGRAVGGVYAANTAGAVFGAVGFGWVGIGQFGTCLSQVVLTGAAGAAAGAAVCRSLGWAGWTGRLTRPAVVVAAAGTGVLVGRATVPDTSWELIAWGREVPIARGWPERPAFVGEGRSSSVAVTVKPDGERTFHVSGRPEASSAPHDMRVERMLGHLPALLHPGPKTVLVVGCGAGVTAGSFLTHPSVERVVVCEIEPLIPAGVAPLFAAENYDVVRDPRVQFVFDDARHFVATTRETFDVVTSDPIHPWVKGSAALYTAEYFELVKRRLNPGGVVAQWVPLYESTPDVVRSELATFFAAFPDGTVWANDRAGTGYDVVAIGQLGPTRIDVPSLVARVDRPDHARVAASLQQVGFVWLADLLGTYAGRGPDLGSWLEGAEINRDHNLRLQYLAGLASHAAGQHQTREEMRACRTYPDDLFVMPGEWKAAFRKRTGFPPKD